MSLVNISNSNGEVIAGIFNKKSFDDKVTLIVHGEQGHKDAKYQIDLAEKLFTSTFRFDFRGYGDSEGEASYNNIANGIEDIFTVAKYFETLGYEIYAVIAFGRGSLSGLKYATSCDKPLSHYINISAPFINSDTHYSTDDWKVYQKGNFVRLKIKDDDIISFNAWDNSHDYI
ncbi:MAG: hypothetical protein EXX96DRAFT_591657 [Benjaminiella poitrasii]|nr:MAG: hypothetical protein EXX96DRAFT_591657 [Benjaminiella poitrasii]